MSGPANSFPALTPEAEKRLAAAAAPAGEQDTVPAAAEPAGPAQPEAPQPETPEPAPEPASTDSNPAAQAAAQGAAFAAQIDAERAASVEADTAFSEELDYKTMTSRQAGSMAYADTWREMISAYCDSASARIAREVSGDLASRAQRRPGAAGARTARYDLAPFRPGGHAVFTERRAR